MYVPAHFAADDEAVHELLAHHGAADLVTMTTDGLVATMLPFVHDRSRNVLLGHFARNNDHWRRTVVGEALVIMRGPDAYVSPAWYESKREHGRVVPTWNYVTVHFTGPVTFHRDPEWLRGLVTRLTTKYEGQREQPWHVTDAPPAFIDGQLRGIVGVEMTVTRVEAKAKLSQNRGAADRAGAIEGLRGEDDPGSAGIADLMVRQETTAT